MAAALAVAGALMQANPTLRWADMGNRGYMQVVLTPAEARRKLGLKKQG